MARPIANLRLRLPETLRKKLAQEAEKSQRSLNSEILWRLGQSLGAEGAAIVHGFDALEQHIRRRVDEVVAKMLADGEQKS
jgi:Arc-like DNA binding domain